MRYKKHIIFTFLLLLTVIIVGCEAEIEPEPEGLTRVDEEPEINVRFPDGEIRAIMMEEYATGVVAGEMKPDWPENAYAAQAILARTYALYRLQDEDAIGSGFQEAQEYKPDKITPEIEDAVSKSRGEIAIHNDEYIRAWFHASAGGETTTAKVGLAYEEDEPPYTKSVTSPDDNAPEDVQNWEVEFSNEEITNALSELGEEIANLENIEIPEKDETGRAVNLTFQGTDNSVEIPAPRFRNELDPVELKSTLIEEIEKSDNGFIFRGSGYGHGVGMSQWGAYAMAKEGREPEEIVQYYFDDVQIMSLYD